MFKLPVTIIRKICILSATSLLLSASFAQASENDPDRTQIMLQVTQYFTQEQWVQLDAMANDFKKDFSRTKDKTFKITEFYSAIDDLYYRAQMSPPLFDYYETSVNRWIKNNPKSASAYIVQASIMGARASSLRGEGYANTVDPTIWPEYNKLLEKEKEFLIKHKDIAGNDPRWYEEMQVVAKLLSDEKLGDEIFEEGYKKLPNYTGIYLQAMTTQLPKWGGSPEGVEKVARLAEKNMEGLPSYAYIWYNAFLNEPDLIPLLTENKVLSWPDIRKGFEEELEKNPNKMTYENYLSSICAVGDKQLYREKMTRLTSGAIPNHWLAGYSYNECR